MTNTNFAQERRVIIPPLYAEEWRYTPWDEDHPHSVDIVAPPPDDINKINDPRDYPYAQVLSRTNLLPCDEAKVALWCGREPQAVVFTLGKYVRDDIAFRNTISSVMMMKMANKYKNTCPNLYNPIR